MASVVVHPANPRRDLGNLTELEESIRELGVLQPPVVLPAARVASAWPQHAGELAGADWVVLMGARRRTAAGNVAGGDPAAHLPVLVREDAIVDDPLGQLDVMTAENVARAPLSPLEEARSFAEQVKSGRSQREIAARMGCSQGQVSKRLKLLALAPALIKELEAGKLEVGEALAYAEAGDHGQMLAARKLVRTQSWRSVTDAVRSIQDKAKAARAVEAATARLAKENVPVIASASQRFGSDYWKQELRGAPTIRQARKDGTAVATISASTGDITYYTTTKPKRSTAARSPAEQQRITDERERRVAMHARQQAAAALAARAPKLTEAHAADIVDAWLWAPGNDTCTLARAWLVDAGVGPDPQLQPYEWWDQVRRGTWPVRVHAAHALALARYEVHARITYNRWNEQDAAWLARLREHTGYQPTEWEQARLADVDERTRATPAPPAGGEGPQAACLAFDHDDRRRWGLYLDLEVDAPHAWAEHLDAPHDVDAAQDWGAQVLADKFGIPVSGWQPGRLLLGHPARLAVFADTTEAAPPPAPAASGGAGEYRLLYSTVDGAWMLLGDDEHLADHDGLPDTAVEQACAWAAPVVADRTGRRVAGWDVRDGLGAAELEYVPELADADEPTAAAA